ncbi:hypothetical protein D3C71_1903760 [compost metagenome]
MAVFISEAEISVTFDTAPLLTWKALSCPIYFVCAALFVSFSTFPSPGAIFKLLMI